MYIGDHMFIDLSIDDISISEIVKLDKWILKNFNFIPNNITTNKNENLNCIIYNNFSENNKIILPKNKK